MSSWFPPRDIASDFFNACVKYTPGTDSAALFRLQAALPAMAEATWFVANGWRYVANRCQTDLRGGLKPEMAKVLADIYGLHAKAADLASGLPAAFLRIEADAVRRANTPGAHTANVPVNGRL